MMDAKSPPSFIAIHLYRWLIFRIMIWAVSSLIKKSRVKQVFKILWLVKNRNFIFGILY
jgi:hypothetical protein